MKPAYLGGVRGYQTAVYRPGMGWSGYETNRRNFRQPAVFRKDRSVHLRPLAVARRRRPGLRTKTVIIASIITIAAVLALIFTGIAQI